ncbi:hypothetical protein MASR2M66_11240 [Chloroflexota bacterium]|nr:SH3 domain-containing protein [Anaerolineales bacterium]
MNEELRKKLEAQRTWRTPAPAPTQATQKRIGWSFYQKWMMFVIGIPVVFLIAFYIWAFKAFPAVEKTNAPSPATESAIIATESEAPIEANTTMAVCAGNFDTAKLHVRFEPGLNGEVRGYLEEGETVIVPLGEQNEPITKNVDAVSWTFIQSPITGWVSTSYLCK